MAQAAVTLLLIITIRGAFGAVTVAADLAHPGRQGRPSGAAPSHGKAKLHSADSELSGDAEPHGVHSAHQGEGAELHRTAGHTHHAAAADLARQVAEEGAKGPKSEEDADEASGEEDAEELEVAEDDAEGFEGPEEGPQPQRSRRHQFAVDAAGDAAEVEQGGKAIMRRHNHTRGADVGEGYLEEEESLVQEGADLAEQARRSGWWSRRRAPPRRRRAPPPPPPPKVDCMWGSWGKWGACSATCGAGKQSTTRKVARQAKGGSLCRGETSKSQACTIKKCTTTSTTTTSTTTTTTTTTTTKIVVKAGASRPVGGGVLALPALALALSLL